MMEQNNTNNTNNTNKYDLTLKIVIAGDWGVGKSAFVKRWADNEFAEATPTIGIEFKLKTISHSGKAVRIMFWDEPPSKRFRRFGAASFRGAAGAFILFKVNERHTFERLQSWFDEVDRQAVKECCKILIGTFADVPEGQRQVTRQEAEKFALDHGVKYFEVSALNGDSVNEAVNSMVDLIMAEPDRYVITFPNNTSNVKAGWCTII